MKRQNLNILLINPSGWQKESVNLGLSYLATPLLEKGFDVLILDLNRFEQEDAAMRRRVIAFDPFLIGISVKTATANEGARLARILSADLPQAPIVGGGPHMTLCAETYMTDHPAFAYGIMGEGEKAFTALATALLETRDAAAIPGVVWRKGRKIIINPWAPPRNLDTLPLPNLDVIEHFSWRNFRYPVVTSRGCPFSCIYCCVNKLTGSQKWRYRSPRNVADEIAFVAKTKGIFSFEIWDDNFTLDISRAKEICNELIARKLSLSWWCHNGIRADRIDTELAGLMKKAGCTSIAFGMETGVPETFAAINKGESLSDVVKAVKIVKKAGIQTVGYFIIGLPGETLDTFKKTIAFQRDLKLDHHTYGMLIPYPNTKVWDIVHEQGKLLCDITQTQHFSDDLVPISFELPTFPKQDMVRAFYMAQYVALFEATDSLEKKERRAHVVYLGADHYLDHVAGMILTCPQTTRHTVVCSLSLEDLKKQRGFAQVYKETELTTDPHAITEIPQSDTIYICVGMVLTKRFLLSNANIIMLNLLRPRQYMVRARYYVSGWRLPQTLLAVAGTAPAIPAITRCLGFNKVWIVFRNQFLSAHLARLRLKTARIRARAHALALAPICRPLGWLARTSGIPRRALISTSRILTTMASIGHFTMTKGKLRRMRHKKQVFSYDEYSSYL